MALGAAVFLALTPSANAGWYRAATYGTQQHWGSLFNWGTNDIAVDANGVRYIPNPYGSDIRRFAADGTFLGVFFSTDTAAGAMNNATAIAVSPVDGTLYVIDRGNDRVIHFTPTGGYLGEFGSSGTAPGQLADANDLVVGNDGTVYVADQGAHRISVFDAEGSFLRSFGTNGPANGQFRGPADVGLSPDGQYLYVSEWGGDRVQKFTVDGSFVLKWGTTGTADGQFRNVHDLVVASDGTVVVGDYFNNRIQQFTPDGLFVRKFRTAYPADQFGQLGALALGPDDNVHVGLWDNFQAIEYQLDGTFVRVYASWDSRPGYLGSVGAVAEAPDGSLWSVDTAGDRVVHLDANGTYLGEFGSRGTDPGEFLLPSGFVIASDSTMYVADQKGHRVQHVDSNGTVLHSFGGPGWGGGTTKLNNPGALWLAADGSVWVADRFNSRVVHLSSTLAWLGSVGSPGTGNGQLNHAAGVAVAADGSIWASDVYTNRVQHFSPAGAYIEQFASPGGGGSPLNIGFDGTIYVGGTRTYRFTSAGVPDGDLGANVPGGIVFAADGSALFPLALGQFARYRPESTRPVLAATQATGATETCLALSATDADSGVVETRYSIDGGSTRLSGSSACVPNVAIPASLSAVASDRAWNDSVPFVLAGNGGLQYSWSVTRTYSSVCFDFVVADSAVATAAGAAYSADGVSYGAVLPARQCFTELANNAGVTARAFVRDGAGNVLTVERADSPTTDTTPPLLRVTQTTVEGQACLEVEASDPETGIQPASYSFDGGVTRSATRSTCLPPGMSSSLVVRNGAGADSTPFVVSSALGTQYWLRVRTTFASACFTLEVADQAIALAAGMRYSSDGTAFATQSPAPVCFEGLGNTVDVSARVYLVDRTGNTLTVVGSATPDRDRTPPTIDPVVTRDWAQAQGHSRLRLAIHDDETGVRAAEMTFRGTTIAIPDGRIDTAQLPEGRGRMLVRAVDRAGNVAKWASDLTVDHTPPAVSANDVIGPRSCIRATDALSGVVEERVCVMLPVIGRNEVRLTVRDVAGNARTVRLTIIRHPSLAHRSLNVLGATASSSPSATVLTRSRVRRKAGRTVDWMKLVAESQLRLRALGMLRGTVRSGYEDASTRAALRSFQRANGIRATGEFGTLTREALDRSFRQHLARVGRTV